VHPVVQLLQLPFTFIPPDKRVRVVMGPLRGARWIVGSGNHVCWLGLYEYSKQLALKHRLTRGSIVYDIGAHVGFHTLLAVRCVGPAGYVFAFEPLPRNLGYLHQHLDLNHVPNAQVLELAVADQTGTAQFSQQGSYMGSLSSGGELPVRTVALDQLLREGRIPAPAYIKMDIEGGELAALHGMQEMLTAHHPTIFLSTHSSGLHRACIDMLRKLGYQVKPLSGRDLFTTDELVVEYLAAPRHDST
jgi:FkbM family methyltransferase